VAGKALYSRLQIADLAGQLSMRVLDLKKTMDGVRQELAHMRHLAGVVHETKQFKLHEAMHTNTRQLVELNATGERGVATLGVLMIIFAGILAFNILDRLTGNNWMVMDKVWFADFSNVMINNYPIVWFVFSLAFWALCAFTLSRYLMYSVFLSGGVMRIRVRIMQRLLMHRFNVYLAKKHMLTEERHYDERNTVVYYSWEEKRDKKEFGYSVPKITVEYDRATGYMLSVTIEYNRRMARHNQALTGAEVRNKICESMVAAAIFEDSNFTFKEEVITVDAAELHAEGGNKV